MSEDAQVGLHEAITAHIADEGDVVTKWIIVAEVSYPAGDDYPSGRYVATRAGTFDGESPQLWDGLGLLAAGKHNLDRQMEHCDREWYEDDDEPLD